MDKSATAEPERAQMTIFYAGKVIVFNEFPADKAKEVMLLASQGSSQSNPNSQNAFVASKLPRIDSNSSIGITSLSVVPPSLGTKTIHDHIQPAPQPLANGNFFLWLLSVSWYKKWNVQILCWKFFWFSLPFQNGRVR